MFRQYMIPEERRKRMKTGNVSSASDMALVIAGMNAQQITCSQTTGKSDSFGIIMERKTSEEMIPEFGGKSDIRHSLNNVLHKSSLLLKIYQLLPQTNNMSLWNTMLFFHFS